MKLSRGNKREVLSVLGGLASFAIALAVAASSHPAPAAAEPQKASRYKYQDDALVYAELAKAPEKARARRNPMATDLDAIAAGANLFDQHCAECHGDTGEGSRKGPSLLKEPVQTATPGALFWLLTNGVVRRGMPVWSKLPEPQRWQLVTYIKSLGSPAHTSDISTDPKATR
jgi:mono/diheme cytochrome c family protein